MLPPRGSWDAEIHIVSEVTTSSHWLISAASCHMCDIATIFLLPSHLALSNLTERSFRMCLRCLHCLHCWHLMTLRVAIFPSSWAMLCHAVAQTSGSKGFKFQESINSMESPAFSTMARWANSIASMSKPFSSDGAISICQYVPFQLHKQLHRSPDFCWSISHEKSPQVFVADYSRSLHFSAVAHVFLDDLTSKSLEKALKGCRMQSKFHISSIRKFGVLEHWTHSNLWQLLKIQGIGIKYHEIQKIHEVPQVALRGSAMFRKSVQQPLWRSCKFCCSADTASARNSTQQIAPTCMVPWKPEITARSPSAKFWSVCASRTGLFIVISPHRKVEKQLRNVELRIRDPHLTTPCDTLRQEPLVAEICSQGSDHRKFLHDFGEQLCFIAKLLSVFDTLLTHHLSQIDCNCNQTANAI